MNQQENIRKVLREEIQKQSLLSLLDQYGLYEFMKMTGLSIKQIISKTGEISREVLESYIKEFIENEAERIHGSDGDRGIVFPIPLSKTKEVESFYLSGDNVTVEINEYDVSSNPSSGSMERLSNLSDEEIYRIVDDMSNLGEDS